MFKEKVVMPGGIVTVLIAVDLLFQLVRPHDDVHHAQSDRRGTQWR